MSKKNKLRRNQIICLFATVLATVFITFGAEGMSTVNNIAPWLMTSAALMLALVIVFNDIVWDYIKKQKRLLSVIIPVGLCVLFCVPTYLYSRNIITQQVNKQANAVIWVGYLSSGDGVNPIANIVPPNAITLLFGNNLAVFTSQSQKYVLTQKGNPFLSIGINSQGFMTLTTEVLDSKGNNIVKIIGNEFHANQNDFYCSQPNPHSVIVDDTEGNEVLNVDFINSITMSIIGTFYISGYSKPVIISPNSGITFPNGDNINGLSIDLTKNAIGFIDFQ